MKALLKGAALLAALVTAQGAMAAPIMDGSFEAQGAASGNAFCYFANYAPTCAGGSWVGGGNTSGLQNEANTAFPGQSSPAGSYYAFIQSGFGTPGSISQALTLATGKYDFSWLAAGRPNGGGNQAYDVTLTGARGVQTLLSSSTTTGQAFTAMSSGPQVVAAGKYTLTFAARDSGGDNSAFIDGVTVAAVPEPATWGMMILGFGLIGGALRRRTSPGAMLAA
jgi:hypothetical protein